jgi:hypothetical protein
MKAECFTKSNEFAFNKYLKVKEEHDEQARDSFPQVEFRIVGARKPGYIINNVLMPILFISGLGLTVFVYEDNQDVNEDFEKRFNLNATVLLTLVAFKFSIAQDFPRVNYLTFADRYILASFAFQMILVSHFYLFVRLLKRKG